MKTLTLTLMTVAAILLSALPSMAQQKRLSPHETISAFFDHSLVSVVYGRPYTKNPQTGEVRKIWGGLVPYGQVWRTGADESTLLIAQNPIVMGGKTIPAGVYTLFTLPAEDGTAKLIVNKRLGLWGAYAYDEKDDLARVDLKKTALEKPVDQFTMAIENIPSGSGVLKMMWENTEYSVAFTVQKTGADAPLSPVARTLDQELKNLEHDLVPLVEAMPAARYDFAPTNGEFKGVRTFRQQVMHVAGNIYGASSVVLGEKPPVELDAGGGGAANLKTKGEIIKYLKDSFVYAHRAMATLTEANSGDELDPGWGKHSRLFMADVVVWHSFDHYGQMVVYARMNGIIPPASRPKN